VLFSTRLGRPSVPIDTLLRLLYLKHRYQLGYESLCREVADSISWPRFCRIALDRPVPHPTTLVKLGRRASPEVVEELNAALLHKLAAGKLLRARKLRSTPPGRGRHRLPDRCGSVGACGPQAGWLVRWPQEQRRSVRNQGGIPDGWRMTWGVAAVRMADMDPEPGRTAAMDPELEAFIALFPPADLTDPAAARKNLAALAAAVPAPDTTDMQIQDHTVPADPEVAVRSYRPHQAQGAIVWLHGGGFVMGDLDTEHPWAARLAGGAGAVVISVGYRRAPEHRFPAALDDTSAALAWTAEHAAELGLDPARIAVGGHSAGAGLAAAVALRARDQQGPPIRFQLLNQPQLDDRQETWSARHFTDTPWMTRDKLAATWRHYLGSTPASPYAAPARAADLSGLPPAYIATAEFDPLRDEAITYGLGLLQAGVPVELHQWPGTFHGSQAILSAEISQRQITEFAAALRRALAD
jgi:acetyl esterase